MKTKHWIIIAVIAFILLAPVEASNLVHAATLFIQNLLSSAHLH